MVRSLGLDPSSAILLLWQDNLTSLCLSFFHTQNEDARAPSRIPHSLSAQCTLAQLPVASSFISVPGASLWPPALTFILLWQSRAQGLMPSGELAYMCPGPFSLTLDN